MSFTACDEGLVRVAAGMLPADVGLAADACGKKAVVFSRFQRLSSPQFRFGSESALNSRSSLIVQLPTDDSKQKLVSSALKLLEGI